MKAVTEGTGAKSMAARARFSLLVREYRFFLVFLVTYSLFVLVPAIRAMSPTTITGLDVGEYAATASSLAKGATNMFSYPYPVVPLIYVPVVLLAGSTEAVFAVGSIFSAVFLILVSVSFYFFMRQVFGSDLAAAVGAGLMGLFPLWFDEVGWGGQAQFLAIVFGILSIACYFSFLRKPRLRTWIGTSLLLLLAGFTEGYVTAFFAIVLFIWGLLEFIPKPNRNPKGFALTILSLVPCGVLIASQTFSNSSTQVYAYSVPLIAGLSKGLFLELVNRIVFGQAYLILVLDVVGILFVLRWARAKTRVGNIAIALWVGFVIQTLLVTPAVYADRGLYFLPLPFGVMAAELGAQSMGRTAQGKTNYGILGCLIIGILIFGNVSASTYPGSLTYYSNGTQNLQTFPQVPPGDSAVLWASTRFEVWPAVFIMGRNVFQPSQAQYFTRTNQIQSSEMATDVSQGVGWVQSGEVTAIDAEPAWAEPSPALYVSNFPFNAELFSLNDALLPVIFSPAANATILWSESPFYSTNSTTAYNDNGTISHSYQWNDLRIVKTIAMSSAGALTVAMRYYFVDSIPRSVEMRLFLQQQAGVSVVVNNRSTSSTSLVRQKLEVPWTTRTFETSVNFTLIGGSLNTKFISSDEFGMPELDATVTPSGASTSFISLTMTAHVEGLGGGRPTLTLENQSLNNWNVQWILVDKNGDFNTIQRFLHDPSFRLYDNSTYYLLFDRAS